MKCYQKENDKQKESMVNEEIKMVNVKKKRKKKISNSERDINADSNIMDIESSPIHMSFLS